jgi:ArsR family transcriptional regulator
MRSSEPAHEPEAESARGVDLQRLVLVAKALSDPMRLQILESLTRGRRCCDLAPPSSKGIPGATEPEGICVCEFQQQLGVSQSKVSYHLHVLRGAGLIDEDVRGKWTFYTLKRQTLTAALQAIADWLQL